MLESPSIGTAEPVFYSLLDRIGQGVGVQIWTGMNVTGQPTNILNYTPVSSTGVPVGYAPQFATTVPDYSANEWQLTEPEYHATNAIGEVWYMQPQVSVSSMSEPNFTGFVQSPQYGNFSSATMTTLSSPLTDEEIIDIRRSWEEIRAGKSKKFDNARDAIEWLRSQRSKRAK